MIQFDKSTIINTVTLYPESASIYASSTSSVYTFSVTQSINENSSSFTGTLTNTPSTLNPRLTFNVSASVLPDYSGQYQITLSEALTGGEQRWGTYAKQWILADVKWSEVLGLTGSRTIDHDRAWISGSDEPSFDNYISSNEQGYYTTYNG